MLYSIEDLRIGARCLETIASLHNVSQSYGMPLERQRRRTRGWKQRAGLKVLWRMQCFKETHYLRFVSPAALIMSEEHYAFGLITLPALLSSTEYYIGRHGNCSRV
jgi:hypothetical protein